MCYLSVRSIRIYMIVELHNFLCQTNQIDFSTQAHMERKPKKTEHPTLGAPQPRWYKNEASSAAINPACHRCTLNIADGADPLRSHPMRHGQMPKFRRHKKQMQTQMRRKTSLRLSLIAARPNASNASSLQESSDDFV